MKKNSHYFGKASKRKVKNMAVILKPKATIPSGIAFQLKNNKTALEFKKSTLSKQDAEDILKKAKAMKKCVRERKKDEQP